MFFVNNKVKILKIYSLSKDRGKIPPCYLIGSFTRFILIGCVAFTIGFQSLIALPETVYIIGIVVVTIVYQLVERK